MRAQYSHMSLGYADGIPGGGLSGTLHCFRQLHGTPGEANESAPDVGSVAAIFLNGSYITIGAIQVLRNACFLEI